MKSKIRSLFLVFIVVLLWTTITVVGQTNKDIKTNSPKRMQSWPVEYFVIYPGKWVGEVTLGMQRKQVLALLGQPERLWEQSLQEAKEGGAKVDISLPTDIWLGKDIGNIAVTYTKDWSVNEIIITSIDRFRLGRELTPHSTPADFLKIYPRAIVTHYYCTTMFGRVNNERQFLEVKEAGISMDRLYDKLDGVPHIRITLFVHTPGSRSREHPKSWITPHMKCKISSGSELTGVKLKPAGRTLQQQVERLYGKPVRFEIVDSLEKAEAHGNSFADLDGTPVIGLHRTRGLKESFVLHELYHLLLQAQGYPAPNLIGTADEKKSAYFDTISAVIYDAMHHYIFFPKMRQMNLDPSAYVRVLFQQPLRNKDLALFLRHAPRESLALYVFRAYVEEGSPPLLKQVEALYREQGAQNEWELGQRMANIVLNAGSLRLENFIEVYAACMNEFLKGQSQCLIGDKSTNEWEHLTLNFTNIECR